MAKHDEEYMAPEVAESIAKHVQDQTESVQYLSTECSPSDS
jgi:cytochrome c-type biogenesis protein CcmE